MIPGGCDTEDWINDADKK